MTAAKTNTATFVSMEKPDVGKLIKFVNITSRGHDVVVDIQRKVWEDNKHVTPPYTVPVGGDFVSQDEKITFSQEEIKRIQGVYAAHKAIKEDVYYINCSTADNQTTEIPVPKEKMDVIDSFIPTRSERTETPKASANILVPA